MKNTLFLIILFSSFFGHAQPDPSRLYPARIKWITEQLKTDSLNYGLIWERLEMQVSSGFGTSDDVFSFKIDSNKIKQKTPYLVQMNSDFTKVYDSVIAVRNFDVVEEGDFYLNRVWFHTHMLTLDDAIEDAIYLRDSVSYSRYSDRLHYYNNWALYSLYNLYIMTDNFDLAMKAVDTMLEKKRRKNPKIYYSGHGSFLNYMGKVKLLEHYGKKDELIEYIKQTCRENFNWYFEKAKYKNSDLDSMSFSENEYYTDKSSYSYFTGVIKHSSFQLLKLLVEKMTKYNAEELSKYERIYNTLSHVMNQNYTTINPEISDEELKSLVSEI